MQREDVLGATLQLLEIQGIASTSLEMVPNVLIILWMNYVVSGPIKRRYCTIPCVISASRWIPGADS